MSEAIGLGWRRIRGPQFALTVVVGALALTIAPVLVLVIRPEAGLVVRASLTAQAPVLGNTIVLGLLVAITSVILALCTSATVVHRRRWGAVVHLAILVPMVMPPWAPALALVVGFGQQETTGSWLRGVVGDVRGLAGLSIAGVLRGLPVAHVMLVAGRRHQSRALDELAHGLGVTGLARLWLVTWPALRSTVGAALGVAFVATVTDVSSPLVIGGGYHVLATRLHLAVSGEYDLPAAAVMAVTMLVPCLVVGIACEWLGHGRASLRVGMPDQAAAGRQRGLQFVDVISGLAALTEVAAVVTVACMAWIARPGVDSSLTVRHVRGVLGGDSGAALGLTVLVALASCALAGASCLAVVACLHGRVHTHQTARATQWALVAAGCVPGLCLGLAAHLWVGGLSTSEGGARALTLGWLVIVLAWPTVAACAPRLVKALAQAHPGSDDAAQLLGMSRLAQLRHGCWPRVAPSLGEHLVGGFLHSLVGVSAVVLLQGNGVLLTSPRALALVTGGDLAGACAQAVVLGALGLATLALCTPPSRGWVA